jgi:hypothetical protein
MHAQNIAPTMPTIVILFTYTANVKNKKIDARKEEYKIVYFLPKI